jgi:N-acyl homoserine lactone hydrolase
LKVSLLVDCVFTVDKSVFLPGTAGKYSGLAKSLLIETPKERILVDTGFGNIPPGPKFSEIRRSNKLQRSASQGLARELAKRGLRPDDITIVVNTHLHAAHSGNNNLLKHAKFFISKEEYSFIDRYVEDDPNRHGYISEFFDQVTDVDYVKGDRDLTEEVRIISTPGHTLGHQSVVVDFGASKLVYSGDVSPLKANLERKTAMTGFDSELTLKSMKKLLQIKDAKWIFSHEMKQLSLQSAYDPASRNT